MPATHGAAARTFAAGVGAAALSWVSAGAAQAQTQTPAAEAQDKRIEALEAEVRALAAEVRALKAAQQKPSPPPGAPRPAQGPPPGALAAQGPPPAPVPPQQGPSQGPPAPQERRERPFAEPRVAENSTHRLRLESPHGYSIALAGLVQFDAGAYTDFRPDNAFVGPQSLSNGVNARRARIGIVGEAPGGWTFGFVYDAGNSEDATPKGIQTAQIVYGGVRGAALEIGYSNTYFTLDQSTSSGDLLFLERSSASNIATTFNTGDARANAGARFFGDRYWIGAYLTGPANGDTHVQTAERFGAFERATVQALNGKDYSLHLGAGVSQLIQAPKAFNDRPNILALFDQPELRIDPTPLLNTGVIGSSAHPVTGGTVYDLETAATYKGLFWQGEYYRYQLYRQGLPSNDFDGWYGQIGWTLTGETHTYNPQAGAYFRIYPAHPFDLSTGQLGAFELAARLDDVDLTSRFTPGLPLSADSAAINGGRQRGVSVGLNWYPNDLIRFMLDYNHIRFETENGTAVPGAPLGAPAGSRFDAVSMRAQFVY